MKHAGKSMESFTLQTAFDQNRFQIVAQVANAKKLFRKIMHYGVLRLVFSVLYRSCGKF